jgi:hypothetical protein
MPPDVINAIVPFAVIVNAVASVFTDNVTLVDNIFVDILGDVQYVPELGVPVPLKDKVLSPIFIEELTYWFTGLNPNKDGPPGDIQKKSWTITQIRCRILFGLCSRIYG